MAVETVEAAGLAAAAAAGVLHPWINYLTAAIEAARLAFDIPARTALTTALVPSDALSSAVPIDGGMELSRVDRPDAWRNAAGCLVRRRGLRGQ